MSDVSGAEKLWADNMTFALEEQLAPCDSLKLIQLKAFKERLGFAWWTFSSSSGPCYTEARRYLAW